MALFMNLDEYERLREEKILIIEEKAKKFEDGYYASYMEAFLDGAPCLSDDEEEITPKNKKLRRIKFEASLKSQGKPIPVIPEPRNTMYSDKDYYKDDAGNSYLKRFMKQGKPPKGMQHLVSVVLINSSRELFLRIDEQRQCMEALSPLLEQLHTDDGYPLPDDLIQEGLPCAYHDVVNGQWYRGVIGQFETNDDQLPLLLVDFGRVLSVPKSSLKALRSDKFLKYEFQTYRCILARVCEPKPIAAETEIIRELLTEAKEIVGYFERDKVPYRVRLECSDGEKLRSIVDLFNEKLESLGLVQRPPQRFVRSIKRTRRSSRLNSSSVHSIANSDVRSNASTSHDVSADHLLKEPSAYSVNDYERRLEELAEEEFEVDIIDDGSDESDDERDERRSIAEMDEESKQQITAWIETSIPLSKHQTEKRLNSSSDMQLTSHLNPDAREFVPKMQVRVASGVASPSQKTSSSFRLDARRPAGMFVSEIPKRSEFWSDSELCVISHIESPLLFYVMRDKNKSRAVRDREKLRHCYGKFPVAPLKREELQVGLACVTTFSVDGQLYRGEIAEINDNQCEIYFVDFGNHDLCLFDKIFPLMKEFSYFPLCVECRLDGLPSSTPLSEELAQRFETFVVPWQKTWLIRFGEDLPSEDDNQPLPVVFYDTISSSYAQNDVMAALQF